MAKFEKVSRFNKKRLKMPVRKTEHAAGYDFAAAEECIIPSFFELKDKLRVYKTRDHSPISLDIMASRTKEAEAKFSLIPTGVKCYLEDDQYLELSIRSSSPLKYWIVLANGVGIIDKDYADNPDNEGEIFFQVINLSPFPIKISKGDIIGQGIIRRYEKTEDDVPGGKRKGGFGSTTK